MMTAERSRVQNSALVSVSAHGAAFGLYLLLRLAQPPQSNLALTQVEFLDLHPAPVQEAAGPGAMRAPRGVRDFLRMALPQLKRSEEAQEGPRELATPKDLPAPDLPRADRLVDKSREPLARGPSLRIKDAQLSRGPAASLSDMAQRSPAASSGEMASVAEDKPSLSLEAVGRRVGRPSGGPAIRIDPNAAVSRSRFKDLPAGAPSSSGGGSAQGLQNPSIDLSESGTVRRGGKPAAGFSVGYGKPGGEISLGESPVARGRPAGLPAAAAPRAAPVESAAVEVGKSKGMEISGPLAGRRLLSAAMPRYPEWARAQGVEAEVVVRFFVSPEGNVLDRMIIERTSGYKELDELCMEALKKMVFVPLPKGSEDEQWGLITYRFRLK